MNRFALILFLCVFLASCSISNGGVISPDINTSGQNDSKSEESMDAIVISFTEDGWHDQLTTGDRNGDVVYIKITAPKKYSDFKITIIDDYNIFRREGLNKKGMRVRLVLYEGVLSLTNGGQIFVSAFQTVTPYKK